VPHHIYRTSNIRLFNNTRTITFGSAARVGLLVVTTSRL